VTGTSLFTSVQSYKSGFPDYVQWRSEASSDKDLREKKRDRQADKQRQTETGTMKRQRAEVEEGEE